MFSNEISHDWYFEDTQEFKSGQGTNKNYTCMRRFYSDNPYPFSMSTVYGDTCGTFNGFGVWEWSSFQNFLDLYTKTYSLQEIAIYEWQFVTPSWFGNADQINLDDFKNKKENPIARNYKLSLYQGGIPPNASGKNSAISDAQNIYRQYQENMIKFAIYRGIDRVFFDISDPSQACPAQTLDLISEIMTRVPIWMEIGVVLEASVSLPFVTDNNATVEGGLDPNPNNWKKPHTVCSQVVNDWARKKDQYCQTIQAGSYCSNSNYVCHGTQTCCDGNRMNDGSCNGPPVPNGCPNSIQVAFDFLGRINENIYQKTNGSGPFISTVIMDKENINGSNIHIYGMSAQKYMIDQNNTNNHTKTIHIGLAGQYSLNPDNWNKKKSTYENSITYVAYPEYYWFRELKPFGCAGCPHDLSSPLYKDNLSSNIINDICIIDKQKGNRCLMTGQYCSNECSSLTCPNMPFWSSKNMENTCIRTKNTCSQDSTISCQNDKSCTNLTFDGSGKAIPCDSDKNTGCKVLSTQYDYYLNKYPDKTLCVKSQGCYSCKYNDDQGNSLSDPIPKIIPKTVTKWKPANHESFSTAFFN